MLEPDSDQLNDQLRSMQHELKALKEALRQLTYALTAEEESQLSPEAKQGLKRLRSRTQKADINLLLPKELAASEKGKNNSRKVKSSKSSNKNSNKIK